MTPTRQNLVEYLGNPTYVILGSGGHTAEMCKIVNALLNKENECGQLYEPVRFILAKSDKTSKQKVDMAIVNQGYSLEENAFIDVPRSREVGQSWLTTIFTTLWSFVWCLWLVWRDRPKLILCNGPGTCVPFCYAAYFLRLVGRLPKKTRIVFIESFCRVKTLSLSGKILLPIADLLVVQWPTLATVYKQKPNIKYFGRIM